MIRPVIIPQIEKDISSQTYLLDSHPYGVGYTVKNLKDGLVQFQHNLYQLDGEKKHLEKQCMRASIFIKMMGCSN
jgi:hypothetical protein